MTSMHRRFQVISVPSVTHTRAPRSSPQTTQHVLKAGRTVTSTVLSSSVQGRMTSPTTSSMTSGPLLSRCARLRSRTASRSTGTAAVCMNHANTEQDGSRTAPARSAPILDGRTQPLMGHRYVPVLARRPGTAWPSQYRAEVSVDTRSVRAHRQCAVAASAALLTGVERRAGGGRRLPRRPGLISRYPGRSGNM